MASTSLVHDEQLQLEGTASLPPEQTTALNDDLLEEIFLRIACPADLARASFRRLITDDIFLRRFRSRHPPLLGFFDVEFSMAFHPVEAPHPNASTARALANNVSFEFLPPSLGTWRITDICDGRVLLGCCNLIGGTTLSMNVLVYDPSSPSRRCRHLPPLPMPKEQAGCWQDLQGFYVVFVPCPGEQDDGTVFRVMINLMFFKKRLMVLVFDSASSSWALRMSAGWDALSLSGGPTGGPVLLRPCYAYGCFYWKVNQQNTLLKLDVDRMEFSTIDLPPGLEDHVAVFLETGEGTLGMFTCNLKFLNYYNYSRVKSGDKIAHQWQMKNVLPLPVHYHAVQIFYVHQGYVFIQGDTEVQGSECTSIYSLDSNKTFKFEMVTQMTSHFCGLPYFVFPPSISQRMI